MLVAKVEAVADNPTDSNSLQKKIIDPLETLKQVNCQAVVVIPP
jgi:hypothetical protein